MSCFWRKYKKTFWVLVYVLTALALSLLALHLLLRLNFLPSKEELISSQSIFLMIVVQCFIFLSLGFLFIKLFRLPYFPVTSPSASTDMFTRIKEISLSVVLYILVMIFIAFLSNVLNLKVDQFGGYNISLLRTQPNFFLAAVALVAPIYEEIIFRGIVLRVFLLKNKRKDRNDQKKYNYQSIVAVIFSSLGFAAFHFDQSAFLPLFILSLYLSALTLYKQNLSLSIFIHALNNFLSGIGLLYVIQSGT